MGNEVVLSERDQLIADMVEAGNEICEQEDATKCEETRVDRNSTLPVKLSGVRRWRAGANARR